VGETGSRQRCDELRGPQAAVGVVTGTGMSFRAGRWVDLCRVNWPLGYIHALQTFEQRGVAWHEVSDLEVFEMRAAQ
jgi:hypothetical protein